MKNNDWVYKQLQDEFGVDWRICREIMESAALLIKKEIESDECWGCIMLPHVGKFDIKAMTDKKFPRNDLIVTSKGVMPRDEARRRKKYKPRKPKDGKLGADI